MLSDEVSWCDRVAVVKKSMYVLLPQLWECHTWWIFRWPYNFLSVSRSTRFIFALSHSFLLRNVGFLYLTITGTLEVSQL
jgi:hypothetical protein